MLEQVNGLITAVGELLGAVLWPALVLFLALRFGPAIMRKFATSEQVTVEGLGIKASFQQKVKAATALGAAEATRGNQDSAAAADPDSIAQTVASAVPDAGAQQRLRESFVLWVDDRPANNRYERQALEALGMRVDIATSTQDALERVRNQHFDLVISDMARPPDPLAGYTLLDGLRTAGKRIPFIIYAGSPRPDYVREARERGALGYTNSPQELLLMVSGALGIRPATG